jgi:hypothetical protein
MTDHEKEIRKLRKGFHRLIIDLQEQRFSQFLKDLDRKIDEKISKAIGVPEREVLRRVSALEKKVASHGRKPKEAAAIHEKAIMRKIEMLNRKISSLEAAHSDFSSELKKSLIPTKKLAEFEASLKPLKRDYEPLLEGLEAKRKAGDKEIARRIDRLEASFEKSLRELEKRQKKISSAVREQIEEKGEELLESISQESAARSKKLNAQFLKWLGSLEEAVKKKVEERLDTLEKLGNELAKARREFAKRKELEELEEHLAAPLGEMDKKIRRFVRGEIERLESDIKKTRALGSIDHRVLQKEINRVVKELERQRTETLEEEIERLVKEGERQKTIKEQRVAGGERKGRESRESRLAKLLKM